MLSTQRFERLRDRRAWPWWILCALALIAGVALRVYQLHAQTLIDDEWHAVRMLIGSDAIGIATHFGYADHSIPLTLYYRALYDLGALSEWQMHLPLLLGGIAMLLVLPWLMRREAPPAVRAIWMASIAISPVLVYLSRTARPYALACLFAFVAIAAFRRWWATRRLGAAVLYVVATMLAAWLHLLSIVFTLWPFVYFGVPALFATMRRTRTADDRRALVGLIGLAVAVVGALAIVLVPPLINDWRAMAAKAGSDSVTLQTLVRAFLMMFGVSSAWLGGVVAVLMALGVWRAWLRDRRFCGYVVSMIVVGMTTVALARPAWIQHQQTFVRYVLPIVPFVLWFVAEGIAFAVSALRDEGAALVATLFIAGLAAAGPIPAYYYAPNQFMGHEIFQFDFDADANPYHTLLDLGRVPTFYRDLSTRPPGSITLIESPARLISNFLPDPWYQKIHRQNVKFALAAPLCGGESDEYPYTATGTRFREMGKLADVLEGATWGADYLVLRLHPWSVPPDIARPWPDMAACVEKVRAGLGDPVYRDDQIVVFALAGRAASQGAGSSARR